MPGFEAAKMLNFLAQKFFSKRCISESAARAAASAVELQHSQQAVCTVCVDSAHKTLRVSPENPQRSFYTVESTPSKRKINIGLKAIFFDVFGLAETLRDVQSKCSLVGQSMATDLWRRSYRMNSSRSPNQLHRPHGH